MQKACDKVARYIAEGREAFMADERTQDAVIRNIEIIGEASKQLSPETKALAPEEPWRRIGQYFGVKLDRVWETAATVLPPFRETVTRLLVHVDGPPGKTG